MAKGSVDRRDFQFVGMLCLVYVAVALLYGGLKYTLNVLRGAVGEAGRVEKRPAWYRNLRDTLRAADVGAARAGLVVCLS